MTDNTTLPTDLPGLIATQLVHGLALLSEARELAGEDIPIGFKTSAMGVAARLMLANARVAETVTRLQGQGGKETVYRQIVEVNDSRARRERDRQKTEEELEDERYRVSRKIYLAGRPTPQEVERREAEEAERVAEERPLDENYWWLKRNRDMQPYYEEMLRAEAEEQDERRAKELAEMRLCRRKGEGD
jgi:hypothetical protein